MAIEARRFRRPRLTVRATLLVLVGAAVALVVALSVFTAGVLGPTAARLSRDSEAIVTQMSAVAAETARLDRMLDESRVLLASGADVPPETARRLGARATRSEAMDAAAGLDGVPVEMRLALAAAADLESQLLQRLDESVRLLAAGDRPAARQRLALADSLHAEFARKVAAAENAGLVSLARKQGVLIRLAARLQRAAPLWVGLALVLSVAALLTLHRRLYVPLRRLDTALQAVARGELDTHLAPAGSDEIDRLYGQFNSTVGILRANASSQERRAESLRSRLGRILEQAADEIYLLDAESLRFLEVNRRALENLGYSREEMLRLTPADLVDEPASSLGVRVFEPLRSGAREQVVYTGRHRRRDGTAYPVELRVHYGGDEDPPVFLAIGLDKSEHQRQEERLRQSQKMEAVGQLTGGVAHDFNNLLTVIQGNLELLVDNLDADDAVLAGDALAATRRGAALTSQLLAFARRQPLAPEAIDLNRLVSDLSELLRRTLGEGLDVQVVLAGGLWSCEADPRRLENVLLNLAINARDAMGGHGTLTIETANARLDDDYAAAQGDIKPGQYVLMAVTDTGQGIPAHVLDHVFEPFFTTKERGRGSGLGLAMVYGFVKQSGGHVRIYSEPGQGTTVKVYLPRSTAPAARVASPADVSGASRAERSEEPRGSGQTVLLVEDDENVRELIVRHLDGLGYRVREAADGSSALALLARHPEIAMVLTDVVLPGGLNGRQLVERARAARPDLPALYMSGYTENAIVHQGRLDAGVRLLQKPFSRLELARKLAETLTN